MRTRIDQLLRTTARRRFAIALALAVLALVFFQVYLRWQAAGDRNDKAQCTALYRSAHTAADSLRIDARRFAEARAPGQHLTCGELRRLSVRTGPPNLGLKLPGRLAALARDQLGPYAGEPLASASKAPARSLTPSR